MVTPFTLHDAKTYRPVRKATVAECRRALAAASVDDRKFDTAGGRVYFPFYFGQQPEDVARFLAPAR